MTTPFTMTARYESWPLAQPFTISRGSKTHADVVVVTLERDGVTGQGECVPYPRYNETVLQVLEALAAFDASCLSFAAIAQPPPCPMPPATRWIARCGTGPASTRTRPHGNSRALHPPAPLTTAYTISLAEPEEMATPQPWPSVRCSSSSLASRVMKAPARHPRRGSGPRLIVDANEGWSADVLPAMLRACRDSWC
jgi:hypothetical protein